MATFSAYDGTTLAYHVSGQGEPLVCLPGGPMQDSVYLGDLGGLGDRRRLIMLDLRGTGESAEPEDPESRRCDRLVDDVEALRAHLGLERMDLLAHSAGANLALRYVERYPQRVARLVLVTPSLFGAGNAVPGAERRETALLRRGEPWFGEAFAALEEIVAGRATAERWEAVAPFAYGRWDETARAHHAAGERQRNRRAAAVYGSQGAFAPDATRAALADFHRPVLVLAGEVDLNSPPGPVAELAALFPDARAVVQAGAGHFPWLDDGARFVAAVEDFLG
jgi:pimeloyl-ACP methyl ester carboxylesterase